MGAIVLNLVTKSCATFPNQSACADCESGQDVKKWKDVPAILTSTLRSMTSLQEKITPNLKHVDPLLQLSRHYLHFPQASMQGRSR